MNTDATADSIERLWDAATRENSKYYVRQFSRISEKGGFAVSWNWPAFFFGVFWFVYRGMYLYAVLAFVAWIPVQSLSLLVLGESEAVYWGTTLAVMVVMGAVANALYLRHVNQRIAREAGKQASAGCRPARKSLEWACDAFDADGRGGPPRVRGWGGVGHRGPGIS